MRVTISGWKEAGNSGGSSLRGDFSTGVPSNSSGTRLFGWREQAPSRLALLRTCSPLRCTKEALLDERRDSMAIHKQDSFIAIRSKIGHRLPADSSAAVMGNRVKSSAAGGGAWKTYAAPLSAKSSQHSQRMDEDDMPVVVESSSTNGRNSIVIVADDPAHTTQLRNGADGRKRKRRELERDTKPGVEATPTLVSIRSLSKSRRTPAILRRIKTPLMDLALPGIPLSRSPRKTGLELLFMRTDQSPSASLRRTQAAGTGRPAVKTLKRPRTPDLKMEDLNGRKDKRPRLSDSLLLGITKSPAPSRLRKFRSRGESAGDLTLYFSQERDASDQSVALTFQPCESAPRPSNPRRSLEDQPRHSLGSEFDMDELLSGSESPQLISESDETGSTRGTSSAAAKNARVTAVPGPLKLVEVPSIRPPPSLKKVPTSAERQSPKLVGVPSIRLPPSLEKTTTSAGRQSPKFVTVPLIRPPSSLERTATSAGRQLKPDRPISRSRSDMGARAINDASASALHAEPTGDVLEQDGVAAANAPKRSRLARQSSSRVEVIPPPQSKLTKSSTDIPFSHVARAGRANMDGNGTTMARHSQTRQKTPAKSERPGRKSTPPMHEASSSDTFAPFVAVKSEPAFHGLRKRQRAPRTSILAALQPFIGSSKSPKREPGTLGSQRRRSVTPTTRRSRTPPAADIILDPGEAKNGFASYSTSRTTRRGSSAVLITMESPKISVNGTTDATTVGVEREAAVIQPVTEQLEKSSSVTASSVDGQVEALAVAEVSVEATSTPQSGRPVTTAIPGLSANDSPGTTTNAVPRSTAFNKDVADPCAGPSSAKASSQGILAEPVAVLEIPTETTRKLRSGRSTVSITTEARKVSLTTGTASTDLPRSTTLAQMVSEQMEGGDRSIHSVSRVQIEVPEGSDESTKTETDESPHHPMWTASAGLRSLHETLLSCMEPPAVSSNDGERKQSPPVTTTLSTPAVSQSTNTPRSIAISQSKDTRPAAVSVQTPFTPNKSNASLLKPPSVSSVVIPPNATALASPKRQISVLTPGKPHLAPHKMPTTPNARFSAQRKHQPSSSKSIFDFPDSQEADVPTFEIPKDLALNSMRALASPRPSKTYRTPKRTVQASHRPAIVTTPRSAQNIGQTPDRPPTTRPAVSAMSNVSTRVDMVLPSITRQDSLSYLYADRSSQGEDHVGRLDLMALPKSQESQSLPSLDIDAEMRSIERFLEHDVDLLKDRASPASLTSTSRQPQSSGRPELKLALGAVRGSSDDISEVSISSDLDDDDSDEEP